MVKTPSALLPTKRGGEGNVSSILSLSPLQFRGKSEKSRQHEGKRSEQQTLPLFSYLRRKPLDNVVFHIGIP